MRRFADQRSLCRSNGSGIQGGWTAGELGARPRSASEGHPAGTATRQSNTTASCWPRGQGDSRDSATAAILNALPPSQSKRPDKIPTVLTQLQVTPVACTGQ